MARTSWLDDDNLPAIDDKLRELEHFTASMADGRIDKEELDKQLEAVVASMKAVESELDDAQHQKVTRLLVELTAFNVMNLLHEMATQRVRGAFGK